MKQKRIYKVTGVTHGPVSAGINPSILFRLREHCIALSQSSDRAYEAVRQRLCGLLDAMDIYEHTIIVLTSTRTDVKTVVDVGVLDGSTILTVIAEREATNE